MNVPVKAICRIHRMAPLMLAVSMLAQQSQALQWYEPHSPSGNTKLLYHFDGTGTTVLDSGPNVTNSILSDAAARAGSSPTWLYTPAGDYLSQSDATAYWLTSAPTITGVDFDSGVTVSGWIRNRTGETQVGVLFYIEAPGLLPRAYVANGNYTLAGYESRVFMSIHGASNTALIPLDDGWHHIAMVYDPLDGDSSNGGTWRFYIDNVQTGTVSSTKNLSSTTQFNLGIGRSPFGDRLGGTDYDEVLLENSAMTSFAVGIPTLSEWGFIILFALLFFAGAWKIIRRKKAFQSS